MIDYQEILPPEALQEYIECFWIMKKDNSQRVVRDIVLPNGCSEIVVCNGLGYKRVDKKNGTNEHVRDTVLIGPKTCHFIIEEFQDDSIDIGIRFKPHGLFSLTKQDMTVLKNRVVGLEELFGKKMTPIIKKLNSNIDVGAKLKILEDFIFSYLNQSSNSNILIDKSLHYISLSNGTIKVNDLIKKLSVSKSTLERAFSKTTGYTPKSFITIWRVNFLIASHKKNSKRSLTELAYDFKYFDQAHFINDFKKFTGLSPRNYFSKRYLLTNILSQEVVSRELCY